MSSSRRCGGGWGRSGSEKLPATGRTGMQESRESLLSFLRALMRLPSPLEWAPQILSPIPHPAQWLPTSPLLSPCSAPTYDSSLLTLLSACLSSLSCLLALCMKRAGGIVGRVPQRLPWVGVRGGSYGFGASGRHPRTLSLYCYPRQPSRSWCGCPRAAEVAPHHWCSAH